MFEREATLACVERDALEFLQAAKRPWTKIGLKLRASEVQDRRARRRYLKAAVRLHRHVYFWEYHDWSLPELERELEECR